MASVKFTNSCGFDSKSDSKRPRKEGSGIEIYEFIDRVDGRGHYLRCSFSAQTIAEANNIIASLYKDKIIDDHIVHAYSRDKDEKHDTNFFSIHAVLHVCSRDFDFKFFRSRLPQATLKLSFYPDKEYPWTKTEVLQVGQV